MESRRGLARQRIEKGSAKLSFDRKHEKQSLYTATLAISQDFFPQPLEALCAENTEIVNRNLVSVTTAPRSAGPTTSAVTTPRAWTPETLSATKTSSKHSPLGEIKLFTL